MFCESVDKKDELEFSCITPKISTQWNGRSVQYLDEKSNLFDLHNPATTVPLNSQSYRIDLIYDPENTHGNDSYNPPSSAAQGEGNEAPDHFERGRDALIDALGHSAAAGIALEVCPPLAIYEGYKAVEAWKEAAQEYNAGFEAEKNNGE